jgi:hypothetical protein
LFSKKGTTAEAKKKRDLHLRVTEVALSHMMSTHRESNKDCNKYGADGISNHPAEQVHQDCYEEERLAQAALLKWNYDILKSINTLHYCKSFKFINIFSYRFVRH